MEDLKSAQKRPEKRQLQSFLISNFIPKKSAAIKISSFYHWKSFMTYVPILKACAPPFYKYLKITTSAIQIKYRSK